MSLVNSYLRWVFQKKYDVVKHFSDNAFTDQQAIFKYLINKAANTEWGKAHHYNKISDFKDYQNVPINDYEAIKPYIERTMKGEQNILWPTEISWFAKSSGTTSDKSKFIPVSKEGLDDNHYKGGKHLIAVYCNNIKQTNLFGGKCLVMGGSQEINQLNKKSRYGDVSAVILTNSPPLGRFIRTPNIEVALMPEWEEKLNRIAEITSKQNITNIAGVPTWTIVLIKKIFELTGKNNLHDVWPNLELYVHGGVSFTPYREQFNQLLDADKMHYYETYNASEGFFAIQDKNDADDMLLLTNHGIFYEFIPMSEFGKADSKSISLEEVQLNTNYAIIISTNSGLWRYLIGDTVKFTSINPFRIQITGRTKSFINAFGEELMVDNTNKALAEVCKQTNSSVSEYTAAPIFFEGNKKGGHEWLVEFEQSPKDLKLFIDLLDKKLQELNSDYEAKRYKDLALQKLILHEVPKGTFHNWLKSKNKLGGQHKVPRLANNRDYIDDIKTIISL